MSLEIDQYAHLQSSLQRWDPRFKMVSLFTLVFVTALLKSFPLALAILFFSFALLTYSRIPLKFVFAALKWVLFFLLPFFILLPLSYPGEGEPLFWGLSFSWEGIRLSSLIVTKAMAIVIISFVVFGSARFDTSMIAAQNLKCPKVLVQMMLFSYRYIFVFLDEMRRMNVAMKTRGFVAGPNGQSLKTLGNFVGALLIRSFERTERVHQAMLSKGYTGDLHTLVRFQSQQKDYFKAALIIILAAFMLAMDHSGWLAPAIKAWY